MNFTGFIFLLIAHYLCGRGVLHLFRLELKPVPRFCLSMLAGVALVSLVPCILQLLHMSIEAKTIYIGTAIFTAVCSIPLLIGFKMPELWKPKLPELYEWPFLFVFTGLAIISVWRCFYYPPYARDMLSGPELLAEFAVREKTMVSSVFTVELSSTNNYFKSPFITSLQIIYKLLVSSFGQVWLSLLFLSFWGFIYTTLKEYIHPVISGLLLLLLLIVPDMFAYTYIILYDYCNMVFFFCGFYFTLRFLGSDKLNDLLCASFFFGIATYIRTETVVLVVMLLPVPAWHYYKRHISVKRAITGLGSFLLFSVLFYFICMNVFVKNFVPFTFDTGSQVSISLSRIPFFFKRLNEVNTQLIFSHIGVEIYGYLIYVFCAIAVTDLILFRKYNKVALVALYGIAVVYIGMAVLGYLIPLVDLMNTTKRGLFKMLPLMVLYMANSPMLLQLSDKIKSWEFAAPKPVVVKEKPAITAAPKKKK